MNKVRSRTKEVSSKGRKILWLLCLFVSLTLLGSTAQGAAAPLRQVSLLAARGTGSAATVSKPDAITQARLGAAYGKVRLSFEVNRGQTDAQVKFLSRGNGYMLFLTHTEAVLVLRKPQDKQSAVSYQHGTKPERTTKANTKVLRMQLVGANPTSQIMALGELPGKSHYFIGNDSGKWYTHITRYGKVRYKEVYPGVDLVYYGNQRQLEYDFVVSPGADPATISMVFKGADRPEIDAQGDLILYTSHGEIRLRKPLIYQNVKGAKQSIDGSYTLHGNNQIGFKVASYDVTKQLIIDPTIEYFTYVGGTGYDRAFDIAVDAAGNAYVTGKSTSTHFPTTTGAYDTHTDGSDAFVTKIAPDGSIIYSTFLGGSSGASGKGIAVDMDGNAYVMGATAGDFPTTTDSFQTNYAGGNNDLFVTKLNYNGSALLFSTYLGGSEADSFGPVQIGGIAVNSFGNAYVTGVTNSDNFPVTNAVTINGSDAFIAKLKMDGSGLVYCSYLGGSGDEEGFDIAVDADDCAYVTGWTNSNDFPLAHALQPLRGGDAFISKWASDGSSLLYSTFFGGSDADAGRDIAVDSNGNAYVVGLTYSNDLPTTPSCFQPQPGGGFIDAFVAKLSVNSTGVLELTYSTYLGGEGEDTGHGVAVDTSGSIYVTGRTFSNNFPTKHAFQPELGGDRDAFIAKLVANGNSVQDLIYSSYLGIGGSIFEHSYAVAVDSMGNAYVTGETGGSTDFLTASPRRPFAGGLDAFVAKIFPGFRFVVTSDMRNYISHTYQPPVFEGALEKIKELGRGAFMISPGDIDGPVNKVYDTITDILGSDYLWYPVVGNHELPGKGTEKYLGQNMETLRNQIKTLPNVVNFNFGPQCDEEIVVPGWQDKQCVTTYSFDYLNAHFVVLNEYYGNNSDTGTQNGDIVQALREWLQNDLQAANGNSNIQHVFVIGHEPAYPQPDMDSGRIQHRFDSLNENQDNRDDFWALLQQYGVRAYICAHTHNYSAVPINGVWQLDAGHARGDRDYTDTNKTASTFIKITINGVQANFETYRDEGPYYDDPKEPDSEPLYVLTDSGDLNDTAKTVIHFQDGSYPWTSYRGTRDTYNYEQFPKNYGSADPLRVDGNDGSNRELYALLKWDVTSIPAGSTVLSARIGMLVTNPSAAQYNLYKMEQDWNEMTATWDRQYQY